MTDNFNPSNSNTKQIQNAFRFSLVMALIMSALSVVSLAIGGMPTSVLHITTLLIVVAIASVISTVLSRRGEHVLGILLLIGSLLFACIATAIQFSGFGAVLAIVTLIISFGAGSAALPRNYQYLTNTISSLLALGFLLLDVFEPFPRLPNNDPTMTWIIAGVLIVLFGFGILRNFSEYNFRTKLIISFIFTSVVTVGILTVFSQNTTTDILRTSLGRELNKVAEARGTSLGDLLDDQVTNLTVLAINDVVQQGISASNQAYTGTQSATLAEIESLDQKWRAGDSALISETIANQTAQEFLAFQKAFPDNAEVFVTDQFGALVGTTNVTSDYYQADEDWWQSAYNDGEGAVYISNPEFDESVGQLSVLIAVPVVDKVSGEVTGVLRTTYLMSSLVGIFGKAVGETGEVDLYFPGDPPFYVHEGGYEPVDTDLFNQLEQITEQPYVEMDYHGTDSVVSQASVATTTGNPAVDNLGWFIAVHEDTAEVFGPAQTQTRNSLGLVIIIVAVAATLAVLLSQVLVGPISRLTATAQEVAAGDLDLQAEVNTHDEVGLLATAFNEMTAQLRNTLTSLEDRIAARTRDLELAAEVGRRLSLVSETEAMLSEAVNIIRERFDLYYTQVYLIDPTGRSLVLRAGTGEAGQTLLRRGHRLPLDMGSLNGVAATERRTVLMEDTAASPLHRPNPLLPETRSELAIPLIVSDRVVGVLNMQSSQPGALNPENRTAFEALAGSLAIAIANAELFQQAEEARVTVETQTRRLTRTGWQDFLDAIERSERVAFTYDQENVSPLLEPISSQADESILAAPIQVSGASVGRLSFKRDEAWTEDEHTIVNAVSNQVAQQIENLRLLAQAEQYRAEAQETLQRLTHEGWDQYQEQLKNQQTGFLYSDYEVKPLVETEVTADKSLTYPITVRDETIGQLEILDAEALSEEDEDLVTFVKEQLGAHLENLRLSQQTEQALAETEELYQGSAQLVQARTYQEILEALVQATRLVELDMSTMVLFETYTPAGDPETLHITAAWSKGDLPDGIIDKRMPHDDTPILQNLEPGQPLIIPDFETADNLNETMIKEAQGVGIRGMALLPLFVGDQWLGYITANSKKVFDWTEDDVRQAMTLAGQAAIVIQSQRLFEQTGKALAETEDQSQRLAALNELSEQLTNAQNLEQILDTTSHFMDRIIPADYISITWPTEDGQSLDVFDLQGESGAIPSEIKFPLEGSAVGTAFKERRVVRIPDLAESNYLENTLLGEQGLRSTMVVPLLTTDRVLGMLNFASQNPDAFNNRHRDLAIQAASLISGIIENQELFAQTQAALSRTDELYSISQTINEATTDAEILEALARPAAQNGATSAILMHLDLDEDGTPVWTEFVADWRVEGEALGPIPMGTRFYLPEMPLSKLWMSDPENPLLISDVKTDEGVDEISRALMLQSGSQALAIIPLTRGRDQIGLLIFNWSQPHKFSQYEGETYHAIIGLASPAVQSRRLFERVQAQAKREQTLRQITAAVRGSTDPTTIMRTAVRELGTALGRRTQIRLGQSSPASEDGSKNGKDGK